MAVHKLIFSRGRHVDTILLVREVNPDIIRLSDDILNNFENQFCKNCPQKQDTCYSCDYLILKGMSYFAEFQYSLISDPSLLGWNIKNLIDSTRGANIEEFYKALEELEVGTWMQ